ncbi:hypothetical protein GLYMA_08G315700v4 [Glycine max]|uniref:Uncharacterized protein n=1 Tax=Glycine max TaxID=3847 RepID=A0A0R0IV89_SOYBN|nr:hypothetical protein GYH30_023031 [Glycine max]KRH46167.1 hypothetical protein GLYMA_08G315700v4 [Glycine max]
MLGTCAEEKQWAIFQGCFQCFVIPLVTGGEARERRKFGSTRHWFSFPKKSPKLMEIHMTYPLTRLSLRGNVRTF